MNTKSQKIFDYENNKIWLVINFKITTKKENSKKQKKTLSTTSLSVYFLLSLFSSEIVEEKKKSFFVLSSFFQTLQKLFTFIAHDIYINEKNISKTRETKRNEWQTIEELHVYFSKRNLFIVVFVFLIKLSFLCQLESFELFFLSFSSLHNFFRFFFFKIYIFKWSKKAANTKYIQKKSVKFIIWNERLIHS